MWAARRPLFRGVSALSHSAKSLRRVQLIASPTRFFSTGDGEAAIGAGSQCCEGVLSRIRQRAGTQLAQGAAMGAGSHSAAEAEASLRRVMSEELAAGFPVPEAATPTDATVATAPLATDGNAGSGKGGGDGAEAAEAAAVATDADVVAAKASQAECAEKVAQEVAAPLAELKALGDLSLERKRLKRKRADCLAVGYQSQNAENMEYCALVVCAVAGIFAVSIHYGFFLIFGVAYSLYRRATKSIRVQHASTDELQGILNRLKELDNLEAQRWAAVQVYAEAWQRGLGAPAATSATDGEAAKTVE